jgi:thiamine-phosphate pyrophosphorylase
MTGSSTWSQPLHASLAQLLEALTNDCSKLIDDAALLHRLSELTTLSQSEGTLPLERAAPSLSLDQALLLTATARNLLGTVRSVGDSGTGGETAASLSEALESLYLKLGAALRREQARRVRGLYVIIDPEVTGGRDPLDIARGAVQGGAKMLQLRDKLRDKGESLPLALSLQQLCQANDVLLIINDHVDLAAAVGSGGVHVGQTDLPIAQARQVLAPHQVLGRSNREFEQLVESQEMGADHVAFGPIYQSGTKSTGRQPQGPQRLRQARDLAKVPLVAIGGINAENVAPVVEAGADAICVTAAVGAAPDPEAAASRLVKAIRDAGGKV